MRRSAGIGPWARYGALLIVTLIFILPLYVLITASLKGAIEADAATMWQLPQAPSLDAMLDAATRLGPSLWNSAIVTVPAALISSLWGALNAFVFTFTKLRLGSFLYVALLVGIFLPIQAVLVPLVQFLSAFRLGGTLLGLILVHVVYGVAFTTLIFRNFFADLPVALVEAAFVDGAGVFQTFWRIVLPLSLPGFVVALIFQFTNVWNDFLIGLVVVGTGPNVIATVQLNNFAGSTSSTDWNVMMAGSLLVALPTIVVYLALGRFFIKGLTAGSIK